MFPLETQNKTTTQDLHMRIRLTLERQTTKKNQLQLIEKIHVAPLRLKRDGQKASE